MSIWIPVRQFVRDSVPVFLQLLRRGRVQLDRHFKSLPTMVFGNLCEQLILVLTLVELSYLLGRYTLHGRLSPFGSLKRKQSSLLWSHVCSARARTASACTAAS
eukprot:gnl/TRDRNA2_/TRDRNA2_172443_c1_seq1.p1 gnl/TRDRNA2_/TRDRNA2_172443_c1~~gnl/TRDRNA2_/TRDRNA2_172443_c1_seq1.p1  ORF type:complete len:104 (-),score=9.84 gnl/TRDRNA2_/TRDRNA2_172443_c1_seq1:327-638(-)